MIAIYYSYISKENHSRLINQRLKEFSLEFQKKNKLFRNWEDAQLTLLGKVMLFDVINELCSLKITDSQLNYNKYGKPFLDDNKISFNISHSGEIVVCAISYDCEIGIDIEKKCEISIEDFTFQMTEKELHTILISEDKTNSFFDYWTQKEAVIKAHGKGLSLPLQSFEISSDLTRIDDTDFFLKEIEIDKNYKCYLSTNKKIGNVKKNKYVLK